MPQKITRARISLATPAATMPTTIALSPASATSISKTWNSAAASAAQKDSFMRWILILAWSEAGNPRKVRDRDNTRRGKTIRATPIAVVVSDRLSVTGRRAGAMLAP